MENSRFEEEFSSIQVDMIAICLEYAYERAEKIYIYISYESKVLVCDFFFKMDGKVLQCNKINEVDSTCDVSYERQRACMNILCENAEKLIQLCNEFGKEMPTEIKITYDAVGNQASAEYSYDLKYTDHLKWMAYDISEQWFEEVKKSEESEV